MATPLYPTNEADIEAQISRVLEKTDLHRPSCDREKLHDRIAQLVTDRRIIPESISRNSVQCARCFLIVTLDQRSDFYLNMWTKHLRTCGQRKRTFPLRTRPTGSKVNNTPTVTKAKVRQALKAKVVKENARKRKDSRKTTANSSQSVQTPPAKEIPSQTSVIVLQPLNFQGPVLLQLAPLPGKCRRIKTSTPTTNNIPPRLIRIRDKVPTDAPAAV